MTIPPIKIRFVIAALAAAAVMTPLAAQEGGGTRPPAKEKPAEKKPAPAPRVTLDAKDADLRETLEKLFLQARISNYSISDTVRGYITISLKDKPFEEALTLISRVASPPLTWSKNDGFYEVRVRVVRRSSERGAR